MKHAKVFFLKFRISLLEVKPTHNTCDIPHRLNSLGRKKTLYTSMGKQVKKIDSRKLKYPFSGPS